MKEVLMKRNWKFAGIALLALATLAPAASAAPRFVGGFRFGGPRFFGPRFYGPSLYVGGFYGPGWYGPGSYGLGWYEPYGYVPGPVAGKIKFDTKMKDARIYVDGAYAGTVGQLGTFPLKAGTHDVEMRDVSGQSLYNEHVDVIAGKTIKIKI
jgi:hypothetical protein